MLQGFQFPTREAEIWTLMRLGTVDFADRNNNYLHVVTTLKSSVALEQAREDMKTIARRLELAYPKENERTGATVNLMRGSGVEPRTAGCCGRYADRPYPSC